MELANLWTLDEAVRVITIMATKMLWETSSRRREKEHPCPLCAISSMHCLVLEARYRTEQHFDVSHSIYEHDG